MFKAHLLFGYFSYFRKVFHLEISKLREKIMQKARSDEQNIGFSCTELKLNLGFTTKVTMNFFLTALP